jgi:hypothetical protein
MNIGASLSRPLNKATIESSSSVCQFLPAAKLGNGNTAKHKINAVATTNPTTLGW